MRNETVCVHAKGVMPGWRSELADWKPYFHRRDQNTHSKTRPAYDLWVLPRKRFHRESLKRHRRCNEMFLSFLVKSCSTAALATFEPMTTAHLLLAAPPGPRSSLGRGSIGAPTAVGKFGNFPGLFFSQHIAPERMKLVGRPRADKSRY